MLAQPRGQARPQHPPVARRRCPGDYELSSRPTSRHCALFILPGDQLSSLPETNMHRFVLILTSLACLGGCASNRTDLVKSGYLSLQPTLTASLAHAPEVFERDGALVVEGLLDSSETTKGGHVDVRVVAPDGTVAYNASVTFRRPAAMTRTGPRGSYSGPRSRADSHATYSVRFPGLPPAGSAVLVRFDAQPHQPEGSK